MPIASGALGKLKLVVLHHDYNVNETPMPYGPSPFVIQGTATRMASVMSVSTSIHKTGKTYESWVPLVPITRLSL